MQHQTATPRLFRFNRKSTLSLRHSRTLSSPLTISRPLFPLFRPLLSRLQTPWLAARAWTRSNSFRLEPLLSQAYSTCSSQSATTISTILRVPGNQHLTLPSILLHQPLAKPSERVSVLSLLTLLRHSPLWAHSLVTSRPTIQAPLMLPLQAAPPLLHEPCMISKLTLYNALKLLFSE